MTNDSRRTFGKELDAVLGAVNTNIEEFKADLKDHKELKEVMIHQIVPGRYQPRREFNKESLKELSDSIAAHGILQPIVVRKTGHHDYEIIAGERRWRAAQMVGLQQVPVIICNVTNESAIAFALIENIQREDLNPIEEAFALKRLIEEFKMSHGEVARSIGRSRAMVSNMLRLLNLTPSVQKLLTEKKIDVGHAKVLLIFTPEEQEEIASIIISRKLTVRATEKLVKYRKSGDKNFISQQMHPKCEEWNRALRKTLSTKVQVKLNELGFGKVIINIDSIDEIEDLIQNL